MTRLFTFLAVPIFCLSATAANAQQIGVNIPPQTIYSSADAKSRFKKRAIAQENDPTNANFKPHAEFAGYKVNLGENSTTNIKFVVSENAQACELHSFNPSPSNIHYCESALAELDLSDKNRFGVMYNMGLIQLGVGETDAAIQTLISAAALSPENPASYFTLAKVELERDNKLAAMNYAKTALSKETKFSLRMAQTHVIIGHLHERESEFNKARISYEAALAINNRYNEARTRLELMND